LEQLAGRGRATRFEHLNRANTAQDFAIADDSRRLREESFQAPAKL
jgi:hypothetical protein